MMAIMNRAWELLYELMMAQRAQMPAIAAEFELSPMQVQLLRLVEPERPMPMGKAACGLGCDASNITGIVDRLEARGLIERRPGADRRVKVLVITRDGARVRRLIMTRLAQPPAAIAALPEDDQRMLAAILARALSQPA
jgi:MarR family transcriptional regulator, organic hydroperoxide resistance regulator